MKKSVLFIILLFAVGMTAQAQKFALIDICLLYTSPSPRDRG